MTPETETRQQAADGEVGGDETLTVTDNRTGQTYEIADQDGTIRGDRPPPDQGRRRRLRPDDLRPGVHEHRVVPLRDHLHRRRQGRSSSTAATRSSSSPSSRPTSRSPTCSSTASCPTSAQLDEWDARDHDPHVRARERQGRSSRASATTPTRWGCCSARSARSRPSTPTPTTSRTRENRYIQTIRLIAKMPTLAAFAYRHSLGQPYVYPDNDLELPGQLPRDDLQDDRAQVRARPAARARARHPLHPPRRPRAELLDQRGAQRRLLAGRSLLGGRGRRRRALRAAARRRQRGRAADAQADRDQGEHPRLHRRA